MAARQDTSLTQRMRAASRATHSMSDALVNSRLLVLFADRVLFGRALSCFWAVFSELDAAVAERKVARDRAEREAEAVERGGGEGVAAFERRRP